MSKIGQKEAVIDQVIFHLPTFKKHVDNAILLLSTSQLEAIKASIVAGILTGTIEYGKDVNNTTEVRSYGRSMVMNHLKKAKELNGGHSYVSNTSSNSNSNTKTVRVKEKIAPKGVDLNLIPEELHDFVKSLV